MMNGRVRRTPMTFIFWSAALVTSGLVAPTSAMASGDCEAAAIQSCETYFPQGFFGPRYQTMEECYEGETEFRCGSGGPPPVLEGGGSRCGYTSDGRYICI